MVETLFKLACLMFSGAIAFTYLIISLENQANTASTKAIPAIYTNVPNYSNLDSLWTFLLHWTNARR